jgi:hypothetical protein
MPDAIIWTDAKDHKIKRMRSEGATWDVIAVAVGVASHSTVIARGAKIGAQAPPPNFSPEIDLDREPLPAGHPLTWGVMVAGSCLDGAPYPAPVLTWHG